MDIEVSNGLQGTEYVIVNLGDEAKEGATVKPAKAILPQGASAAGGKKSGAKQAGGISSSAPPAKNSQPKK